MAPFLRIALPLLCMSSALNAQRLHVPAHALTDSAFDIVATRLPPDARAELRATMRDSAGRRWSASMNLRADARGRGAIAAHEAMQLITAMDLDTGERGRERFVVPRLDSLPLNIELRINDSVRASAIVLRSFLGSGVRVELVGIENVIGIVFRPKERGRRPALLVLGGSEGGISGADVAALLASHGYVALAVGYFGAPGLPPELEGIPLERFVRAVDQLSNDPSVDPHRIGVLGTSKGAEAALLLASIDERIRGVVAYAPSAVSWSCICARGEVPSWTLNGAPVPYVPPGRDPAYSPPAGTPLRPAINYRYRLRDSAAVARARIAVVRSTLLISGGDDGLWPSEWSAAEISAHARAAVESLTYPSAGHLIGKAYMPSGSTRVGGGRLETGGTSSANAEAQRDAWPKVLRFLARTLR